jgi:site-specific DNA recombinase
MSVYSDKPQALVYCRVSTKQQEDGTSLDSQASACVKQAEKLGYSIGRVTKEIYSGAELWDRPALAKDRADIRAKRFRALICYATDRLSRDPIHLAIIASECDRAGVALIFVTEPLDNTPEGQLIRYVKGYAAQVERAKIKERSIRGKHGRLLQGKLNNSGVEKYGYRRNKELGIRVIYEPEARVVKDIFRWVAEEKVGAHTVVNRLRDAGIPCPSVGKREFADARNPQWGKSQVQRILHDPAYKGETVCWKWKTVSRSKFTLRPEDEHIRLPEGTTPPIVDPAMWQAAQDRLKRNKGQQTRNKKHFFLLRGLIYCLRCKRRMYPTVKHGQRAYRCKSQMDSYTTPCGDKAARADKIEAMVLEWLQRIITEEGVIRTEMELDQALIAQIQEDMDIVQTEIQKLSRGIERLIVKLRDEEDEGTSQFYEKEIARTRREQNGLIATFKELEDRLIAADQLKKSVRECEQALAAVRAEVNSRTPEQLRLALEGLKVEVFANRDDEPIIRSPAI